MPGAEIVPCLFLRDEMAGNDVICDFLFLMDVPVTDVALPEVAANKSLSRVASEALGHFAGGTAIDKRARRRLGRVLQNSGDPRLFGRDDVLNPAERTQINEMLEARNASCRETFFSDRDRLFVPDINTNPRFQRGDPSQQQEYDYVVQKLSELAAKRN